MATEKVLTPEFRVAFPHVFQAHKANANADPKFAVTMVFPKDADLSALKKLAAEAAREKWGDKIPPNLRSPFRSGAEKAHLDGFDENVVFVTATSKYKPGLVNRNVEAIIDETEFYGGCYARATVNAFAYDTSGNRGVSFGIQNVQKLRDGQPFGGRTAPEEDFEPVPGEEDIVDGAAAPPPATGDDLFA